MSLIPRNSLQHLLAKAAAKGQIKVLGAPTVGSVRYGRH